MASLGVMRNDKFRLPTLNAQSLNEDRKPKTTVKRVRKIKKSSASINRIESSASQLKNWLNETNKRQTELALSVATGGIKKKRKKKKITPPKETNEDELPSAHSWVRNAEKTNVMRLSEDSTKKKKMGIRPKRTSGSPDPKSPRKLTSGAKTKRKKKASVGTRMSVIVKNVKQSLEILKSQIKAEEDTNASRDSIHLPVRTPQSPAQPWRSLVNL